MHLLALLGFLKTEMPDFSTLSHTLTGEIPTLSYTWNLKKVPLLGGAISHYFENIPGIPECGDWNET